MRAFERWTELTRSTLGYFMPEAAAAWDVLLDFQDSEGIAGLLGEIGVFHGKSASLLAMHTRPGERLVLVDLDFPGETRELLDRLVPSETAIYLQGRSSRLFGAAETARWPRAFRWFHIDGEHTGQAVTNDLQLADLWLDESGIICLDDFFNPMYPQLTAAVFGYLSAHRHELTMFLCGHNKAYLCRPLVAHLYLDVVRSRLIRELEARGVRQVTVFKTTQGSDMNCFGIGFRFKDLDYYGLDADPTNLPL